ncbi:MAG TPA: hypothetical protein VN577_00025 [Terriglobales bacterium]|nr:hypothetical protein [Terriglobales bacterium]
MLVRKLLCALVLTLSLSACAAGQLLKVIPGTDGSGRATQQWREMMARRLPEGKFREIEPLVKPYNAQEQKWLELIESKAANWETEIPRLAAPFRPVAAPEAQIVVGNRGADDAFTHDPHTIGFDVERLNALYGNAQSPENVARIDRFFRHEYTHLLQKAWFAKHPSPLNTPLRLALTEMWTEGMGNFYSLSETWRSQNGRPAPKTVETLRVLEPRMLARLSAVSCASSEQAQRLTRDLSNGHFDEKWGALPVALWLERESTNPETLRNYVLAGPDGFWDLARRNLSPELKLILQEIRAVDDKCKE